MNAGLANLFTLKQYLLAFTLQQRTDWDAAIAAIGLGVAGAFENYCNRSFARVVNDQVIIAADRCQFFLPRTPVESVSLIELQPSLQDGYTQLDAPPWVNVASIDLAAGIVSFPEDVDVGEWNAQVRFTYTGGYFWETVEPLDPGFPTAIPASATVLPDALRLAWLLQCAEQWKWKDKLGQGITNTEEKIPRLSPANLADNFLPQVKSILSQYVRQSWI